MQDMLYSFLRNKTIKISIIIKQFTINSDFAHTMIMEGYKHIFWQSLIQPDFVSNIIVEILKNIIAISTLRCCRHTEEKFRPEVFKNLLICISTCVVRFINNYIIKCIWRKGMQIFLLIEGLHSGKKIICICIFSIACI